MHILILFLKRISKGSLLHYKIGPADRQILRMHPKKLGTCLKKILLFLKLRYILRFLAFKLDFTFSNCKMVL